MAFVRRPLETEQADTPASRQVDRICQPLPRFVSRHVGLEDAHHVGGPAASRGISPRLRRAQPAIMDVADAARLHRGSQQTFGETGFARRRHRAHVEQGVHAGRNKKIEELVLNQPLISDREKVLDQPPASDYIADYRSGEAARR